jgi:toxin CptA
MPTSTNWSGASAICQLEWRPSPALGWILRLLGGLGAISVLNCELPSMAGWPLAVAAMAYGAWLAQCYRQRPVRRLWWVAGRQPEIDGVAMQAASLHWRGPLAFLQGRDADGRTLRLAWWPDTLPRMARRELRLVAQVAPVTPATPAMAP